MHARTNGWMQRRTTGHDINSLWPVQLNKKAWLLLRTNKPFSCTNSICVLILLYGLHVYFIEIIFAKNHVYQETIEVFKLFHANLSFMTAKNCKFISKPRKYFKYLPFCRLLFCTYNVLCLFLGPNYFKLTNTILTIVRKMEYFSWKNVNF